MNPDSHTDTSPLNLAISDISKKEKKLKSEETIRNLEKELKTLKTFSPRYQINTRSKNITEHTQLDFETKAKSKMAEQGG